jgi:hypothetical protein
MDFDNVDCEELKSSQTNNWILLTLKTRFQIFNQYQIKPNQVELSCISALGLL